MPTGVYVGNKGKTYSKETRRKIGLAKQGSKNPMFQIGQKHPKFKGRAVQYWRRFVTQRDDYTCQICGLKDPEIVEVDHIFPKSERPDLAYEPSNMMTLCPNCHVRKTKRDRKKHS